MAKSRDKECEMRVSNKMKKTNVHLGRFIRQEGSDEKEISPITLHYVHLGDMLPHSKHSSYMQAFTLTSISLGSKPEIPQMPKAENQSKRTMELPSDIWKC